jgi:hypothetical protein
MGALATGDEVPMEDLGTAEHDPLLDEQGR